jgi:hypothetical protein
MGSSVYGTRPKEDTMPNYIGFLRGTEDAQTHLSPTEAQQTLERYIAWNDDLARAEQLVDGNGLSARGRVIRGQGADLAVTDGPFVETSEILGGYIVITATDLDEAEKIFSSHPHLEYGSVEVRKVGERGCEP